MSSNMPMKRSAWKNTELFSATGDRESCPRYTYAKFSDVLLNLHARHARLRLFVRFAERLRELTLGIPVDSRD